MAKSIAFVNIKGGVGKTTGVYNVAGELSKRGYKILCIDLDRQMNLTRLMLCSDKSDYSEDSFTMIDVLKGEKSFEDVVKKNYIVDAGRRNSDYYNIDVIPSSRDMKKNELLREIYNDSFKKEYFEFIEKEKYDYVLVDLPANSEILNEICFNDLVNYVIVPFTPNIFSLDGYDELMNIINEARQKNSELHILGIYLSQYRGYSLDKKIKSGLESFGKIFIDVQIPTSVDIETAIVKEKPLPYYTKREKCDAREAYRDLVDEINRRIESVQ